MEKKWTSVFDTKSANAIILAIGLAVAGWFVYTGIHEIAVMNRTVTVKGLSERDVTADYVVWPLNFSVSGNDIPLLYQNLNKLNETTKAFFIDKGFKAEEITLGNVRVEDNWSGYYTVRPANHYTLQSSLIIATKDVQRVIDNQGCQSELLSKGVILNSYEWSTEYSYKGLSELKPEMIEEATKNARAVAQKFADDSHSRLGGIRNASQGQFSIESDNHQPWVKHVRVVTTVDYSLK